MNIINRKKPAIKPFHTIAVTISGLAFGCQTAVADPIARCKSAFLTETNVVLPTGKIVDPGGSKEKQAGQYCEYMRSNQRKEFEKKYGSEASDRDGSGAGKGNTQPKGTGPSALFPKPNNRPHSTINGGGGN